jgi:hypothetical protein
MEGKENLMKVGRKIGGGYINKFQIGVTDHEKKIEKVPTLGKEKWYLADRCQQYG